MNNSMEQDLRITNELGKFRLAPPSLDLQDRILTVARQSMEVGEADPDDIPWKFPVFRFAASLVIAVLVIIAGNLEGDSAITQWQNSPASLTASIDGVADAPLTVRLAVSDPARSQCIGREQFLNYQRQVQELSGCNQ